jgi:hypothetical protein
MPKIVSTIAIYPLKLTHEARQKLSETLYNVHKHIFKGLNEEEFDHYVVNSPANFTKIYMYYNKSKKEIAGYFAVHYFEKFINNKQLVIFRAEAGILPEYRHKNADISFWLKESIKFKILHPNKEAYFLVSPINPGVYANLATHIYKIYPRYNSIIPSEVDKLMMLLADEFSLKMVEKKNPLIRKVGWITLATDEEDAFWQRSKNPHLQFYINSNPDFNEGNGLLTLVPLTFLNLFLSFFSYIILYTLKKKIRYRLRHFLG